MAASPNPAPGSVAALSEKEAFGKLQPASREPPGAASAKKVRTEERKAPRRVNGDGSGGRQPASYGGPAAWSFAPVAAASSSSPAAARSCFSPPASAAPAAPPPQPLPRTLLLAPSLLHARPQHVLLPPAAPPSSSAAAAAKPRRPKDRREREKRRHGVGGARDENGEARPSLQPPPPPPRGGCRRGRGAAGARAGAREGGWRRLPVRAPRDVHGAGGLPAWALSARDGEESGLWGSDGSQGSYWRRSLQCQKIL